MSFKYVVVVPYYEKCISSSDITNIGKAIGRKDPQLLWKPVNMQRRDEVQRFRMPSLPSIMVPFHSVPSSTLPQFKGPRLKCQGVHKAQQLRMLDEAGIRVPKWTRLDPDTEIDPAEFGENLIIKPTEKGASLGRGVTLIKTSGFKAYRDQHAAQYLPKGRSAPLVQQHIPTGGKAEHYRISTFLGHLVSCRRTQQLTEAAINSPMQELVLSDRVASNEGGSAEKAAELCRDAEVEALGLRVAELFDSVTDGIDIVRSSQDGELFVLEINMGNTWHFSSILGAGMQTRLGIEAMRNQFKLYETVADATIERAKLLLNLD